MRLDETLLARTSAFLATVLFGATGALAGTLYVDLNSANPQSPFADWSTAATNIQDAVDAAAASDTIVVTNGIYATGGRTMSDTTTNRLAINKVVTVVSVNGPQFTVIKGYQVPGTTNGIAAVRCVSLAAGASLSGFTLANGATRTGAFYGAGRGVPRRLRSSPIAGSSATPPPATAVEHQPPRSLIVWSVTTGQATEAEPTMRC